MSIESRLRELEKDLNGEKEEFELEDGTSVYLGKDDQIKAVADSIKITAGGKTLDEADPVVKKLLQAKPGQGQLPIYVQEMVENAEDN